MRPAVIRVGQAPDLTEGNPQRSRPKRIDDIGFDQGVDLVSAHPKHLGSLRHGQQERLGLLSVVAMVRRGGT